MMEVDLWLALTTALLTFQLQQRGLRLIWLVVRTSSCLVDGAAGRVPLFAHLEVENGLLLHFTVTRLDGTYCNDESLTKNQDA